MNEFIGIGLTFSLLNEKLFLNCMVNILEISLVQHRIIVILARVLERLLSLICALGHQRIVVIRIWTIYNCLLLRIISTLLWLLNRCIIVKLSGAALLRVLPVILWGHGHSLQLLLHRPFIVTVFGVASITVRIVELKLTYKLPELFQSLLFWIDGHLVGVTRWLV